MCIAAFTNSAQNHFQDNDLCSLTAQDKSYLELYKEYESYEEGLASEVPYDESMHDRMLVVKRVLIDGAEFTKYGYVLGSLSTFLFRTVGVNLPKYLFVLLNCWCEFA